MIIKENFPSFIEIVQENFEYALNRKMSISKEESMRRQINCLRSKIDRHDQLSQGEYEDVVYILKNSVLFQELKGVAVCL